MNRGVVVLFHQSLGNQNRIFEVVTTPGHKRYQNVSAQSQLAAIRTRTVRDDLTFRDALANVNDRSLIDTGVLVRTLELDQRVDIGSHFARNRAVNVVIRFDDGAFGVDVIDNAVALGHHNRTRIARSCFSMPVPI